MTEILAEQLETEESMFVQTAQGIDSNGQTLTLRGITPSTLYFSDRPKRVVGHMTTGDFVDLWAIGDNTSRPTRRTRCSRFSSPTPTRRTTPWWCSSSRTSTAPAISPTRSRCSREPSRRMRVPVTLFIDPFGRPLSPISVCGIRRRERRRMRRRGF